MVIKSEKGGEALYIFFTRFSNLVALSNENNRSIFKLTIHIYVQLKLRHIPKAMH